MMSAETSKNKALMRRVYDEMWIQANPALAVELFAQPEGVERFVSQFLGSFPDLRHTVEEMIAEGDRVSVQFSARGTHQGQWLHFTPTGISVLYTGVTWARLRGDKIIAHQTWWDKAGLMEQLEKGQ
jgi:predicted ester cyclase